MKVSYPHNKSQVNDVIQCMSLIQLFHNVHLHITLNIEKCEHFKFCLLLWGDLTSREFEEDGHLVAQ